MHYVALATDYDGTIAHDGHVDPPTITALEKLRQATRRLILVTGRELPDLQCFMPELDLFDVIVAENGGLLYWPATREEQLQGPEPDQEFVKRLRELKVEPLSVGRVIVATWEPNETRVLGVIHELGLELNITFNKGAVMVLPAGINKASGLRKALEALDLSPLNCVAVGDAENDMAFLEVAGASVAVANALPALKQRAVWVTHGERGAGVTELIDRLLETDLADFDAGLERQTIALAEAEKAALRIAPHRETLLLAGASGSGKSTFTQGIIERLDQQGFQFCVLDPEGDYEALPSAVVAGSSDREPKIAEIIELLGRANTSVVMNLLATKLDDRPAFLAAILPELLGLRSRLGRPHFVIIDEAHHMLPAHWDPGAAALPGALEGFLFVTTQPDHVSPRLLEAVDRFLVVGQEPKTALEAFCRKRRLCEFEVPGKLQNGEIMVLDVRASSMARLGVIPGIGLRMRHRRKYLEGELGDDRAFWFRGPQGKLRLRAQNLMMFVQMADGVDDGTWQWHRSRKEYSRWFEEAIKDPDLAAEAAAIESADLPPDEARKQMREAIERRYTLPA